MILTADVIPASMSVPVARTRLHVSGVPGGVQWRVTGTSGHHSWVAASGVSHGRDVWCTDPMAPLGMEAAYRLDAGGLVDESAPVIRPVAGSDLVTDMDGRTVARVDRMADTPDPWNWIPGSHILDIPGSRLPSSRLGRASVGQGEATVQTAGADTRALASLVESRGKLVVLHDQGVCEIEDCDIAPSILVTMTGFGAVRTEHVDKAHRSWGLTWREARPPWRYAAPVVTHRDVRDRFGTHRALVDSGLSHAEIAAGDWL